jgi:hypothetical protein
VEEELAYDSFYAKVTSSMISNDGKLVILPGKKLKLLESLNSLKEISIEGGELLIDPSVRNFSADNISLERLTYISGSLLIQSIFSSTRDLNISISDTLKIQSGSIFSISIISSSTSNLKIFAKYIFIEDSRFEISHFGKSVVQLESSAIGVRNGTFSNIAPDKLSRVELLMSGFEEVE